MGGLGVGVKFDGVEWADMFMIMNFEYGTSEGQITKMACMVNGSILGAKKGIKEVSERG